MRGRPGERGHSKLSKNHSGHLISWGAAPVAGTAKRKGFLNGAMREVALGLSAVTRNTFVEAYDLPLAQQHISVVMCQNQQPQRYQGSYSMPSIAQGCSAFCEPGLTPPDQPNLTESHSTSGPGEASRANHTGQQQSQVHRFKLFGLPFQHLRQVTYGFKAPKNRGAQESPTDRETQARDATGGQRRQLLQHWITNALCNSRHQSLPMPYALGLSFQKGNKNLPSSLRLREMQTRAVALQNYFAHGVYGNYLQTKA